MRRFAGIGIMLLALAGCQSLPALVRLEVDGSTLEFKKKAPPVLESALGQSGSDSNRSADAPSP